LWVIFALLDPDPDPEYRSGSGSTGPIEYGSNPDPDPDPKPRMAGTWQKSRILESNVKIFAFLSKREI
jgi:hypothetical protein